MDTNEICTETQMRLRPLEFQSSGERKRKKGGLTAMRKFVLSLLSLAWEAVFTHGAKCERPGRKQASSAGCELASFAVFQPHFSVALQRRLNFWSSCGCGPRVVYFSGWGRDFSLHLLVLSFFAFSPSPPFKKQPISSFRSSFNPHTQITHGSAEVNEVSSPRSSYTGCTSCSPGLQFPPFPPELLLQEEHQCVGFGEGMEVMLLSFRTHD